MLKAAVDALLSIIYPQECSLCRRSVESADDGNACAQCWAETRIFDGTESLCPKCGAYFEDASGLSPGLCHECSDHKFEFAAAAGVYEKGLASAVLRLKSDPFLPARAKRHFTAAALSPHFSDRTIAVPVPLSRKRAKERGFNQAAVLAKFAARSIGIHADLASLVRTAHTPIHRAGMDRRSREKSVKKAFEVVRPKLLEGQHILLVDDVMTSGATASACADALKKGGAASVKVLTLARAVLRSRY